MLKPPDCFRIIGTAARSWWRADSPPIKIDEGVFLGSFLVGQRGRVRSEEILFAEPLGIADDLRRFVEDNLVVEWDPEFPPPPGRAYVFLGTSHENTQRVVYLDGS